MRRTGRARRNFSGRSPITSPSADRAASHPARVRRRNPAENRSAAAGCTHKVSTYCDESTPCTDPTLSCCDLAGDYADHPLRDGALDLGGHTLRVVLIPISNSQGYERITVQIGGESRSLTMGRRQRIVLHVPRGITV